MAAPMKSMWDRTTELWTNGSLVGKIGAVFTSAASVHGGQETTAVSMMFPMFHHSMILIGVPYSVEELTESGSPYGASTQFCIIAKNKHIGAGERVTLFYMNFGSLDMKIISAIKGTPSMSKEEVHTFFEKKLNLQIGTIDDEGDPNIQPVWFNYDKDREKLLIITPKAAKKIQNLRKNPNVYFSIDDENFPYKGVKGKGIATVVEDALKTVPEAKKINMKYLGTLDHPIPRMILEGAEKGNHVIVEIDPKFFSTWDFAKMQ